MSDEWQLVGDGPFDFAADEVGAVKSDEGVTLRFRIKELGKQKWVRIRVTRDQSADLTGKIGEALRK